MPLGRAFLRLTLPPVTVDNRLQSLTLLGLVVGLGLAMAWLPPSVGAVLVGGLIFGPLILARPLIGLYLLIPAIPFSGLFGLQLGGARVGLLEAALAGTIGAWLLQEITHPPIRVRFYPVFFWPLLLFLGVMGLSWLNALSLGASLVETIKWIEMLALYLFIMARLSAAQIKWVVVAIFLTGMAQAGLGLWQFIFKVGPAGFLLFGGRFLRAYGSFAQPNPYAGYLGLILPLALSITWWGVIDRRRSDLWRQIFFWLGGAAFGLLLLALFASQSRGGWLAFVAAILTVMALRSKKALAVLTAAAVGMGLTALVGSFDWSMAANFSYNAVLQRVVEAFSILTIRDISTVELTDANFSTLERLAHWQAARHMWRDNLWLGVGFGNYAAVYPAYVAGRWLDPLGHAHNYLLNIGAETGLIGITAYLILWIFVFGVVWMVVQRSRGLNRAVAIGAAGILVHLHVHNLFDNLYVQGMYLHIAIILGLVSVIYHQPQEGQRIEKSE